MKGLENGLFVMAFFAATAVVLYAIASVGEKMRERRGPCKSISARRRGVEGLLVIFAIGGFLVGGLYYGDRMLNGDRSSSSYGPDDFYEPCTGSMRC